ncbi:MAG: TetR/AcrR family transcriptional regulator C-terminal domain-containing protein [Propionibacteriaceae bacterium]|nr:TetR/AcrR family transcriptional regulator C-terminal domain-containing protein [Propionibacteriaceae bacterium]
MTPRKPGNERLSRDQIVAAALALIDDTGLEGHSMRTLGARLGVDASTLYYHVQGKDALHSLIVDEIMSGIDLSADDPSAPTAERLFTAAIEFRRALLAHPRAVPLVAARSMRTTAQLALIEVILGILYEAGFSVVEALVAVDAIGQTVIGMTGIHAGHLAAAAGGAEPVPFADLPVEKFPNVRRLLAEGTYLGAEAEFEATVRALVNGLVSGHDTGTLVPAAPPPGATPSPSTHE